MADKAHIETDIKLEQMERHLSAIYSRAGKEIEKSLREFLNKSKKKSDKLLQSVKDAETREDLSKAKHQYILFYKKLVKTSEFIKLSESISENLYEINNNSAKKADDITTDVYALNYNYIGKSIKKNDGWNNFSEITADEAKKYGRTTQQSVDKKKDVDWNARNIATSIVVGASLFLDAEKIAKRAATVTAKKNLSSAKMQTSGILSDAESKGRYDCIARANDEGFEIKKVWKAIIDERTRDSHIDLDGVELPIDKEFMPGLSRPRDPNGDLSEICNCRCMLWYEIENTKGTKDFKKKFHELVSQRKVKGMTYGEWMNWRFKG